MDFKNYVQADIQKDGFLFTFTMPAGCTFKAASDSALEISKNIESWSKQAEDAKRAQVEAVADAEALEVKES